MDVHELQLASAEVASIEGALGDARRSVADAEAERQRLVAEGPAVHRKKDLLDKVGVEDGVGVPQREEGRESGEGAGCRKGSSLGR